MIWDFDRFAEKTAVISNGREYNYRELKEDSDRIFSVIGRRCLVAVFCTNTYESLVGYIGCINNSIVPLMVDINLEADMKSNLLNIYKPAYYWIPKADTVEAYTEETILEFGEYILIRSGFDKEYDLYEELALLITTSGSTGSPKLVRQSYKNIISNTESIVEYLNIDSSERAITTLPMNYVYGLSIINTHLYCGASLVITDKSLFQKEFWQLFNEYNVTSFGGVPYTYEMLDRLRMLKRELPTLRTMTQAGGRLSKELHQKFSVLAADKGIRFCVMYGASEATARMSYLPCEFNSSKIGSIGIAIPGGRFELIGNDGKIIETVHQSGELVYYGDNVTLGYAECGEDLVLGDMNHGRLETGDIAERDEDGFYYIVGRKKRFLKMFGKRVNLDEVEQLLRSDYPDLDMACTGVDDRIYVFVADQVSDDAIISYLSDKLRLHSSAFFIRSIDSIPKNSSGKTLYSELLQFCR